MLRIRIEVVSNGKVRTIAAAELSNLTDSDVTNYSIRALEHANPQTGSKMWAETGFIDGHDRVSNPGWRLVERAAKFCADAIDNRYRPTMKP